MMLFAVMAVASLGFVMTSLSSTALARTDAVAKNLNQQLLESMRNLPYFTHANVSTVPDLLDTYYTSTLTAASGTEASGFVAATAPRNPVKGDPATGPFFRRVLAAPSGYAGYSRRVTAQFVGNANAVLAHPVFDSTSTGSTGLPPSATIAVRVTTLWETGGQPRQFTVESQITEGAGRPPLVTLQARMSLLRFTGVLPDSRELLAEAGVLNLDGSLSSTTVASAVVQAASAGIADGSRIDGAAGTLAAPPTASTTVASLGPRTLTEGSELAAVSGTSVTGLAVSSDAGLPGVGTATAPVTTVVHGNGLGGTSYFKATHLPTTGTRLGLLPGPVVRAAADSCGGSCEAVKATGTLASTSGPTHSATAALGGTVTGTIGLLPTTTSPEGLIKLTLSSFALTCQSAAGSSPPGQVALTYSGTVSHRTYDPIAGYGYSVPVAISSSHANDPLTTIDPMTIVGVDGSGIALHLSDYVQSWSSLTSTAAAAATVVNANGTAASITVPGVFTFTSTPLRAVPGSTFGLQLGSASCTAGDIR